MLAQIDLSFLPRVNATLNGLAACLLILGLVLIKQKRIEAHKKTMLTAFVCSCVFLVSYLAHYGWRASVQSTVHTQYNGEGLIKWAYYTMLLSHILLAMTVPVFAVWLIRLGLRRDDARHRRVAKIAFPIWLYVSVTGVLIYFMLYHFNPPRELVGPGVVFLQ